MTGKDGLVLSDNENKQKPAPQTGVNHRGLQQPAQIWKMPPTVHRRTGFGIQELLGLNKEPAAGPRRPLEVLPHRGHVLASMSALGQGGLSVGMGLLGPEGIHSFYSQPAFLEVLSEAQNVHLQPLHRVAHMDAQMDAQNSASSGECAHKLLGASYLWRVFDAQKIKMKEIKIKGISTQLWLMYLFYGQSFLQMMSTNKDDFSKTCGNDAKLRVSVNFFII